MRITFYTQLKATAVTWIAFFLLTSKLNATEKKISTIDNFDTLIENINGRLGFLQKSYSAPEQIHRELIFRGATDDVKTFFQLENFQAAIALGKNVLSKTQSIKTEQAGDLHRIIAFSYLKLNNLSAATPHFRQATRMYSQMNRSFSSDFHDLVVLWAEKAGKISKPQSNIISALSQDFSKNSLSRRNILALIDRLRLSGHYSTAKDLAEKVVSYNNNDSFTMAKAYLILAKTEISLGNMNQAREFFFKATSIPELSNGHYAEAYLARARLSFYEEKYNNSLQEYMNHLNFAKPNSETLYEMIAVAIAANHPKQAEDFLFSLRQQHPNSVEYKKAILLKPSIFLANNKLKRASLKTDEALTTLKRLRTSIKSKLNGKKTSAEDYFSIYNQLETIGEYHPLLNQFIKTYKRTEALQLLANSSLLKSNQLTQKLSEIPAARLFPSTQQITITIQPIIRDLERAGEHVSSQARKSIELTDHLALDRFETLQQRRHALGKQASITKRTFSTLEHLIQIRKAQYQIEKISNRILATLAKLHGRLNHYSNSGQNTEEIAATILGLKSTLRKTQKMSEIITNLRDRSIPGEMSIARAKKYVTAYSLFLFQEIYFVRNLYKDTPTALNYIRKKSLSTKWERWKSVSERTMAFIDRELAKSKESFGEWAAHVNEIGREANKTQKMTQSIKVSALKKVRDQNNYLRNALTYLIEDKMSELQKTNTDIGWKSAKQSLKESNKKIEQVKWAKKDLLERKINVYLGISTEL